MIRRVLRSFSCCTPPHPEHILSNIHWNDTPFVSMDGLGITDSVIGDCRVLSNCHTLRDSVDVSNLVNVLQKNYRYIDFTIERKKRKSIIPIIRTRSSSITLEECLIVIREFGWRNTDLPLFVNLQIPQHHDDMNTYIRILFEMYLEPHLVPTTKPLFQYPLKELQNKIVLFSSEYIPYLDAVVYDDPVDIPIDSDRLGLCNRRIDTIYRGLKGDMFRVVSLRGTNYDTTFFTDIHFTPVMYDPKDEHVITYETSFHGTGITRIPRRPEKSVCFF